jgi:hypothetical protein
VRTSVGSTGPPRKSRKVDAAESNHGTSQSRYQPDAAGKNPQVSLWRQVHNHPVGLVHLEKALSRQDWQQLREMAGQGRTCGINSELYKAAAQRPSDQLERLLHMVDRRLDCYRSHALALARIRGVLETELERRAFCYEVDFKPGTLLL